MTELNSQNGVRFHNGKYKPVLYSTCLSLFQKLDDDAVCKLVLLENKSLGEVVKDVRSLILFHLVVGSVA